MPGHTPADIAETEAALGLHDASPVMSEPFRQWAIEDRFVSGAPPGSWPAEMVEEVAPRVHEAPELNGAHSSLAYLGYLAGHGTVPTQTLTR